MEVVSLIISELSATQFLVKIQSQQGLFAQRNPSVSWGSSFSDNFQVGSDSIFACDCRVNRDCVH